MNPNPWQARVAFQQRCSERRPSNEDLGNLYLSESMSYADIARRFGVTKTTVYRWLRAAGIPARDVGEATSLGMRGWKPTEEHRKKMRANAVKARAGVTSASFEKQRQTMKGRPPPNKGKRWTVEIHEKHSYRQTDEYREAAASRQRGELASNWRGGASLDDRQLSNWKWKRRRRECYERDGYVCRDCSTKCTSVPGASRIQAHHVVPRRLGGGDDLGNLVTLCTSCHHKREWKYRDALIA